MLPEKFKDRMRIMLGEAEYALFEESFGEDEQRHHSLRVNSLKADRETVKKTFDLSDPVDWEENGFYYEADKRPGKHPFHESGLYYIQEASAMSPVVFLDPGEGERILDLCAAPGGKTTQIACAMKGKGLLIANEINKDRAKILSLNVERMGVKNAMVLNEDSDHLADVFEGYFDKILVDAPCSGEGMFRKNQEAFTEWSPENVRLCADRQRMILDNAARMLAPGGTLVYSTCTFAPDEDEESVCAFLLKHKDFHTVDVGDKYKMERGNPDFMDVSHFDDITYEDDELKRAMEEVRNSLRLWPHKLRGEGHFLCVLKREGQYNPGRGIFYPTGRIKKPPTEVEKLFKAFCEETLSDTGRGRLDGSLFMFGDQLYLAPDIMPSPNSLKVLRPGLHLGTVKKDRFEPSHALALFLRKEDVISSVDFDKDSKEIMDYLNGQTIRGTGDMKKGWCLVTVSGFSAGFAKNAGGMLKNHYPKGLRINC